MKKPIHKSRLLAFRGDDLLVLEKVGYTKKYTLAGGVRKKKETDVLSLIREVCEEIGVKISERQLDYFVSRRNITKEKRQVLKHYFVAQVQLISPSLLEPHKFKRVLWLPWYEALEYLDKEDRSAVVMYCDQKEQEAHE